MSKASQLLARMGSINESLKSSKSVKSITESIHDDQIAICKKIANKLDNKIPVADISSWLFGGGRVFSKGFTEFDNLAKNAGYNGDKEEDFKGLEKFLSKYLDKNNTSSVIKMLETGE